MHMQMFILNLMIFKGTFSMIYLLVNFPVVKLKFLLMYLFIVSKEEISKSNLCFICSRLCSKAGTLEFILSQ